METGLAEIRDLVASGERPRRRPARDDHASRTCSRRTPPTCSRWLPSRGRRLKVVVDAGNGMAGHTAPAVFGRLGQDQVELVPMYFELDGTFPNHEANPIEPENLVDLQKRVVDESADIGLAFDGDADRCFLVDERGAGRLAVDADRADRRPRAGQAARQHRDPQPDHQPRGARDRHRARRHPGPHPRRPLLHQGDDGRDRRGLRRRAQRALLLPRLLAGRLRHARRAARPGRPRRDRPPAVRRCSRDYERYAPSGEINSTVADPQAVLAEIEQAYAGRGLARRPARRADRHPRRLVVQRPPVQHRAAAAAQRRRQGRGHHGRHPRRRPRPDQEEQR